MICFSRSQHVEPTALRLVEQVARQPSIRFELLFENQIQHSLGQLLRERRGWETHLYQQYQVWPRGRHGSHHRFSCLDRDYRAPLYVNLYVARQSDMLRGVKLIVIEYQGI